MTADEQRVLGVLTHEPQEESSIVAKVPQSRTEPGWRHTPLVRASLIRLKCDGYAVVESRVGDAGECYPVWALSPREDARRTARRWGRAWSALELFADIGCVRSEADRQCLAYEIAQVLGPSGCAYTNNDAIRSLARLLSYVATAEVSTSETEEAR